jgi:hypothetical protein
LIAETEFAITDTASTSLRADIAHLPLSAQMPRLAFVLPSRSRMIISGLVNRVLPVQVFVGSCILGLLAFDPSDN